MDDQILFLYDQGMSPRESCTAFKALYDANVSASLTCKVTNAEIEQVIEWLSCPLDQVSPIVYLDSIVIKIRQEKQVTNQAIY